MEPKELTPSEFSALWHDAGNAARIAEEASNRHDALTFYRVSDQQKALADALRAHFTAVELRKMKEKADEALLSLLPTPGNRSGRRASSLASATAVPSLVLNIVRTVKTVAYTRKRKGVAMPRKDPITGVEVMTMGEFLNAEAQREGTTPEKIMEEIHQAEEDDNQQQIAEYKRPEVALKMLKDAAAEEVRNWYDSIETGRSRRAWRRAYPEAASKKPYNNPRPPYPLEIVEIVAANYAGGFRHAKFNDTPVQIAQPPISPEEGGPQLKLPVGTNVVFTNDYGVSFVGRKIERVERDDYGDAYYLTPTDTPWFPARRRHLTIQGNK